MSQSMARVRSLPLPTGSPPSWVSTIFGVELRGLQMAAACGGATGIENRTGCLSLLEALRRGAKRATSSSQYYARIWHVIFACFDAVVEANLEWMPAHTKAADVGRLRLSNSLVLSAVDRMAKRRYRRSFPAELFVKAGGWSCDTHKGKESRGGAL